MRCLRYSADQSVESERYVLEECGSEELIMLKERRRHPMTKEEKATNALRSRIRVIVEHTSLDGCGSVVVNSLMSLSEGGSVMGFNCRLANFQSLLGG